MDEFMNCVSDLREKCRDLSDGNCICKISPDDEIRLNMLRLQLNGLVTSTNFVFTLNIDINNIKPDEFPDEESTDNSQLLPRWFINQCREIENMMEYYGFETLPSIRRPTDWEHFDTIDELSEATGLIREVQLLFRKIGE